MKTVELGWDRNARACVDHFRSTGYSNTITTTTSTELRGTTVRITEPTWCTTDKDLAKVKKIIFNPPATIVIWKDKHKEVVKCSDDEEFQPEVGVAMCFMKRIFESRNQFTKMVDSFINDEDPTLREIIEEGIRAVEKKYKKPKQVKKRSKK